MSADYIQPNLEEWLEKFTYATYTKVRVCETDLYTHVNNTSYSLYFEQGRADYLEALGFYEQDLICVVGDIYCRFHNEAYVREDLEIKIRTSHFGNKSLIVESVIQRKSTGDVIASNWSTLIIVDNISKKSIPVPVWMKQAIHKLENIPQNSK